jgi:hypothetical protein
MDLNRIFSMALRMLVRRLLSMAIGKGVQMASRTGASAPASPEDAAQQAQARDLARRARKAARLTRRLGR